MPAAVVQRILPQALPQSKFTYTQAVEALNSLQPNSAIRANLSRGKAHNATSIPETIEWFRKAGYDTARDFDSFNAIHVAGTKGKGSTCAFITSILKQYIPQQQWQGNTITSRIGMYTSPHLRYYRERIQIDGEPLSEAQFAKYFSDIWTRLDPPSAAAAATTADDGSQYITCFKFLTITAFHAFKEMNVDTAVVECGIGGEYDTTNILQSPTITAITTLGIDHLGMLGDSIRSIAWHKAGIFKPGSIALTVPQAHEPMQVLQQRAEDKHVIKDFHVINVHPDLGPTGTAKLGLEGDFQAINASLAAVVAALQLRKLGGHVHHLGVPNLLAHPTAPLPEKFKQGLLNVKWPGRCEVRKDTVSDITWYLDGAHTTESIHLATKWYAQKMFAESESANIATPKERVLIFNQQVRDARPLAAEIYNTMKQQQQQQQIQNQPPFGKVIFTTNVTTQAQGYKPDLVTLNNSQVTEAEKNTSVQQDLADFWLTLDQNAQTEVEVTATIEEALANARNYSLNAHVFILGSLYLVGGVIDILERDSNHPREIK